MRNARRGLKALGLSILAALGLMVFGAGAQAQEWLIGSKTLKELSITSETITGQQIGVGRLNILKLNLLIKCSTTVVSNSDILPLGHGKGTISFSGCQATDLKLTDSGCIFAEPMVVTFLA